VSVKCPKCQTENPDTLRFCGDCGTQLPSLKDVEVTETMEAPREELTRGTTFAGRYEIIEELGKGGMGRVYRVEDKKLEQESISIAKQICEGLVEAHRLGVVHRDLKSNNIMIDKEGNVRIMDFGIARSLEAKGITGAGVMIGTPEYMSPEQVEGKEVDQRSDIYSLGIILYEMVTGRVPFEGDTPFTIGMKHKGEVPKNPKEHNTQIPDDLSRVILRCLEKDKEKRYQSTREVHSELANIEKGIPTTDRLEPKVKSITSREITVQFNLKKSLIPVLAVVVIVAIGLMIWSPWTQKESFPIPGDKPSIAVLPFYDLSPNKDQEYFCDGLASELINRLTKIEKLRVPAQASSFSFKGKKIDVQEVGEKLKVESILTGSLQKAENRLRITVELVKVSDGYPIWSEKYERDMEDIFTLQDEISLSIINNLRITLLGEEKTELVMRYTKNPEAYDLFLKGLHYWNIREEEELRKAIDYFEQAIKLDSNYALAYARLAESYGLLAFYTSEPPKEVFTEAKEAVLKALDIDETLAETHSALGFITMYYDRDWEAAEEEMLRAIQLRSSYVTAHHWYAEYLTWMGRHEEAIAEIDRAHELDPLSPLVSYMKAYILFYARKYERSIEQCQQMLEMDPNFTMPYTGLGKAYLQKGMYDEAIKALQKVGADSYLGLAYGLAGKRNEALGILEEMVEQWRRGNSRAFPITRIYVGLGENDLALDWLEKSFERNEPRMIELKVDPFFDSLRSNPRFKALLKKMNLE